MELQPHLKQPCSLQLTRQSIEKVEDWPKNARGGASTSVPPVYTVGQACSLEKESRREAWATDAIWVPNV